MGDVNQLLFISAVADKIDGPILEVGSRDYGNTQNFRDIFREHDYLGIDMQDGKGVDMVLDLAEDFVAIDRQLGGKRFGAIICMSVLEHCRNPFKMAENIENLLMEGGHLIVSAPFVWEVHGFPDDYWRFTPSGIRQLFPNLDFSGHEGKAFTGKRADSASLDGNLFCIKFSYKDSSTRKRLGYSTALFASLFKKFGVMKRIFSHRCVFPSVMISMVGEKRGAGNPLERIP